MSDMPKTTYLLTAMALLGLYLWRTHRGAQNAPGTPTGAIGAPLGAGTAHEAPSSSGPLYVPLTGGSHALPF